MKNQEYVEILKKGATAWNTWRMHRPQESITPGLPELAGIDLHNQDLAGIDLESMNLSGVQLSAADLRGGNLQNCYLSGGNLSGTDLRDSNLREGYFLGVDLSHADLRGADLSYAHLNMSDLAGADLRDAKLDHVDLRRSILTGALVDRASFSRAIFESTLLAMVDLSKAVSLELVAHTGPSFIDVTTIYFSHGRIPHAFLAGCGLPDHFIRFSASVAALAPRYTSCKLVHSIHDQELADKLLTDLQANDVRCWLEAFDTRYLGKVWDTVDPQLPKYSTRLFLLSANTIDSDWIAARMTKGSRHRSNLIPSLHLVSVLSLQDIEAWKGLDTRGNRLSDSIQQNAISDFSNWRDHNAYELALSRLLEDLHKNQTEIRE